MPRPNTRRARRRRGSTTFRSSSCTRRHSPRTTLTANHAAGLDREHDLAVLIGARAIHDEAHACRLVHHLAHRDRATNGVTGEYGAEELEHHLAREVIEVAAELRRDRRG